MGLMDWQWGGVYKPVRLDAQGRAVRLDAQGRAEQRLGRAERSGLAGRSGGLAEQQRQWSFWAFPLQSPPFQNCIDPMQTVEVEQGGREWSQRLRPECGGGLLDSLYENC